MRLSAALTHLCALLALGYARRAMRAVEGWEEVPRVDGLFPAPAVSVIVPARNEERSIERCVRSLLAQRGLGRFEVVVVDDRSDDRTPEILARLALDDPRLRVVRGAALPAGWVGKPWACAQGAAAAHGAWLLFTDADSDHAPEATVSALAYAQQHGVEALSIATRQELGTFAERAVLPTILGLIVIATGPLRAVNDPADPDHALANGQYLLVRRDAYEALGGHAVLRGAIVEDVEFARLVKRDGRFGLRVAGGTALVGVRMYHGWGELRRGFVKNVYAGAEGHAGRLAGAIAGMLGLGALPAALALLHLARRRPGLAAEAAGALALTTAVGCYGAARVGGLPWRLGLLSPLGLTAFAAIVTESWWRVATGRGVAWRGRVYSGRRDEADGARPAAAPGRTPGVR